MTIIEKSMQASPFRLAMRKQSSQSFWVRFPIAPLLNLEVEPAPGVEKGRSLDG